MCIVSIAKEVLGRSMAKFSIFIRWSLPITFRLSFFNSNPECSSSMLRRLMAALIESFCNAFREMFAIMLRKRRCCGLNFPGVSFSDSTSYETFPRRISKELIRRSRLFFFWTVSLDANASSTNWKLGLSLGVCLLRLMLKPNNCMLLMDILPLNRGRISNLAERRVTFSISLPDWSSRSRSSMMMRFSNPMFIRPMEILLFSMEASSLATNTDICRWTDGMFSNNMVPIYNPNTIPSTQRTVFFSFLIGG